MHTPWGYNSGADRVVEDLGHDLVPRLGHANTGSLGDLLALLTEQAISAAAFLDMLFGHAEDPRVGRPPRRGIQVGQELFVKIQLNNRRLWARD